ncbi:MAG TPA: FKBP-type peptidyl-prolyl cis-trans isomerase [Chthonomonadaceae bacterium]|nr:FKBP-type peptidyl-prolyl cis-trans isomerase [Chthonomonadaceae bacterium]
MRTFSLALLCAMLMLGSYACSQNEDTSKTPEKISLEANTPPQASGSAQPPNVERGKPETSGAEKSAPETGKGASAAPAAGGAEKSAPDAGKKEEGKPDEGKAAAGKMQKTASGLQYQHLKVGTGASPTAASTVKVNYRGTLEDGTEFDSSYKHGGPIEFPLNGVIPGWTEGIQLMKVGGKIRLVIPGDLAYGPNPPPGSGIPPNATLIFEVELLDVK